MIPLNDAEIEHLTGPRPVEALKCYRERTGASLRDAGIAARVVIKARGLKDPFSWLSHPKES